MRTIWLRLDGNLIIDVAETATAPQGYHQISVETYPTDLMSLAYRLVDGVITRDEGLYAEYLARLEQEQQEGE